MDCILCKLVIEPGTKTVELAGGFFDRTDQEFFVVDDAVLVVSYLHFDCLKNSLSQAKQDS